MLVRRLNLARKSGDPNQCLRLGHDAKTDRTFRARFRDSASCSSALTVRLLNLSFFLLTFRRRRGPRLALQYPERVVNHCKRCGCINAISAPESLKRRILNGVE